MVLEMIEGEWKKGVDLAISHIPSHISSRFTYMDFHRIFNFPILSILILYAILFKRIDSIRFCGLSLFCIVAFVAATPWDIHLVAKGVWGYEPDQVLGTVYGVPYEEYLFFIIQTMVSSLVYFNLFDPQYKWGKFSSYHRYPFSPSLRKPIRIIGGLFWLGIGISSLLFLDTGKQYYHRLILSYYAPFISSHWFSAGDRILRDYLTRGKLALSIGITTIYYWFADSIAIKLGSWRFSEEHSTGDKILGNLPHEEALFFFLTNVLIIQSVWLFERYFIQPDSKPTRAQKSDVPDSRQHIYDALKRREDSEEQVSKRSKKKIVVIGAGLGGVSVAGRLAKAGYQVTVVEKNEHEGGRCDFISRDGHRFDVGPSIYLMPQLFEILFNDLDENAYKELGLLRVDPLYNIRFADGTQFIPSNDLVKMKDQLEKIEPGAFIQWMRYIQEGHFHYYASIEHVIGRNFRNIFEYFDPRKMQMIFSLRPLANHWKYVSTFFKSYNLKSALTFQNMYLGLSPFQAQATFSLLQYTEFTDGIWYPRGGMYEIPKALRRISERFGAKYRFNSEVKKIVTEKNDAKRVVLKDGSSLEADIVVCNADLPFVYDKLLNDSKMSSKLDRLKYTSSAVMFYWAVDKVYSEIQHHNIFLGDNYEQSCNIIFDEHDVPKTPSFYINAPQRTDDSCAPKGQDSLMVLVPVGHLDSHNDNIQFWKEKTDFCRTYVINRLKKDGIVGNDFEKHIKWEETISPLEWRERYNLEKGVTFGLGHEFWQIGFFRPKNKHSTLSNVYFSGASTHPGSGMPLVLLSAKLATERILEDEQLNTGHY